MKVFTFQGTPREYQFKEETHQYEGGYLQRLIANNFPEDGLYFLVVTSTLNHVNPRWALFSKTPNQVTYGVFPFLVKNGTSLVQASFDRQFPLCGGPRLHDYTRMEYYVIKHRGENFSTDVVAEDPDDTRDVYDFVLEVMFV